MPSPIDMRKRAAGISLIPGTVAYEPKPGPVDVAIAEVDHILTYWLDKGMDMEHAHWATEITTNNIQEVI